LYDAVRSAAETARQTTSPVVLGVPTALLTKLSPDRDFDSGSTRSAPAATPAALLRKDQRRGGRESLLNRLATRLGPGARFISDGNSGTRLGSEPSLTADQWLGRSGAWRSGSAIPIAIGAKLARPDLPIVALTDQDGFLASGTELLTALTVGAAVITVVLRTVARNGSDTLPRYDAGSLADAVGVEWVRLDRDGAMGDALDYLTFVTGQGRPMVLEIVDEGIRS
ncbi:MAG: thiamine pyrophosphate-dependent enzyme, partial [Gemmatimonadales bacterium]